MLKILVNKKDIHIDLDFCDQNRAIFQAPC